MSVDFKSSETHLNLMRAFAGESQARNRYTFAAEKANKQNLYVIQQLFKFTANQEKAHASIFFNHLEQLSGQTVTFEAGYPVEVTNSILELLRFAQHDETSEHVEVYPSFEQIARDEGFIAVAQSFKFVSEIEKKHSERFTLYADYLENNKLFESDNEEQEWMCLNCGHIHKGKKAPGMCACCQHNQGYFVRLEDAPF